MLMYRYLLYIDLNQATLLYTENNQRNVIFMYLNFLKMYYLIFQRENFLTQQSEFVQYSSYLLQLRLNWKKQIFF